VFLFKNLKSPNFRFFSFF